MLGTKSGSGGVGCTALDFHPGAGAQHMRPPFPHSCRRPPAGVSRELRPCQDERWSPRSRSLTPGAWSLSGGRRTSLSCTSSGSTRCHPNCCYLATQQHVQVTRVSIYSVRPQEEAGEAVSPHGMTVRPLQYCHAAGVAGEAFSEEL